MATKPIRTRSSTLKTAARAFNIGVVANIDALDEASAELHKAARKISASAKVIAGISAPISDDETDDAE